MVREEFTTLVERLRANDQFAANSIKRLFSSPGFANEAVRAIAEAPTLAAALHELGGHLWDQSGNELFAVDILKEAAKLGAGGAFISLAEALFWLGADEDAVIHLARARELRVGDPAKVSGMLGEVRLSLGDASRDVENLLAEGAAVHPEFGVSYAKMLCVCGEHDAARAVLEALVDSNEYGAALHLGNLLDDVFGETEAAISSYLRGIDTGDAHSAFNLAVLYYGRDDLVEAERFLRVAREMGDLTYFPNLDV